MRKIGVERTTIPTNQDKVCFFFFFSDKYGIKEFLEEWNKVEIVKRRHITGLNKTLDKVFLKAAKV